MTLVRVLGLPFARLFPILVLVALFMALTACAALNPIAHAETPEQKYDAALLTYDAILEPALELLEDPTAPANLRRSLQTAIAASGEIYGAGVDVFSKFKAAKAEVAAGGPGTVLATATANLENWMRDLDESLARIQTLTASR